MSMKIKILKTMLDEVTDPMKIFSGRYWRENLQRSFW